MLKSGVVYVKSDDKLIIRITKSHRFENRMISFIYIFMAVVILISLLCGFFSISEILGVKSTISDINTRIDKIETTVVSNSVVISDDSMVSYYRELSDKTDSAIDRILTIVGLIAAIVSFFGLLLTFRAPQDITDQINQVREVGEKANVAAENAQYQLAIFVSINFDSNNNSSDISRVNKLTKIISQYPDKPDAYVMRARVYELLGQQFEQLRNERFIDYLRLAISDYSVAMALGADKGDCNNNIGIVYTELGEDREALKYYNKAISANSLDKEYFINRGTCYEILGEYHESLADFGKALQLDESEISAYYGRSFTYHSLWEKEENTEQKLEYIKLEFADLKKAKEIDPNFDPAVNRLTELENEILSMGMDVE